MKRLPPLIPVLALISALFLAILVFTYIAAKRANPQMLDEHGHVLRTT